MSVRVIYSTEAFAHKNAGKSGTQSERNFSSLDEAKAAEFPEGHTFAFISMQNGRWVYHSAKFGWEFQEIDSNPEKISAGQLREVQDARVDSSTALPTPS